jgi:peptidoglycan hydrolase CwlO-like protein
MQWELLISSILTIIGTTTGYIFGRRKQRAEAQMSEIDNVSKSLAVYREMIDDLSRRINEQNKEIQKQEAEIRELREEIRKMKSNRQ